MNVFLIIAIMGLLLLLILAFIFLIIMFIKSLIEGDFGWAFIFLIVLIFGICVIFLPIGLQIEADKTTITTIIE